MTISNLSSGPVPHLTATPIPCRTAPSNPPSAGGVALYPGAASAANSDGQTSGTAGAALYPGVGPAANPGGQTNGTAADIKGFVISVVAGIVSNAISGAFDNSGTCGFAKGGLMDGVLGAIGGGKCPL